MYLSDQTIQRVRDAIDIAELIGSYVDLKPAGKQLKACCPFHEEKTPSFFVTPDAGFYKCFGCGASGDGIRFIMQMEHLDFQQAVTFLAQRYHIPIEAGSPQDAEQHSIIELDYRINEESAHFFYQNLLKNRSAQHYLAGRGLKGSAVNAFYLGYADGSGDSLYRYLTDKGYEAEDLLRLGLIARSNRGTGYYDKFRNRIMFPILSVQDKIIGFGGRALVAGGPKYLNSPDSEIFHKGEHLYHLNQAKKMAHTRGIIVVEGYMDVVSLAFHGVSEVVASLGTSLTEAQAKLVKRYSDQVYLCYDGDSAGIRAARRGIEVFQKADITPKLILLPDGKDPDDIAKSEGAEGFQKYVEQAMDPRTFELRLLQSGFDLQDPVGRMNFLKQAIVWMARLEKSSEREVLAQEVAELADVSASSVRDDVQMQRKKWQEEETQKANRTFSSKDDFKASATAEPFSPVPSYWEEMEGTDDGAWMPEEASIPQNSSNMGMNVDDRLDAERFRLERELVRLARFSESCEAAIWGKEDFIENKGLQELLRAIHTLREQGIPPEEDWLTQVSLSPEALEIAKSEEMNQGGATLQMEQEIQSRIEVFRLQERRKKILEALRREPENSTQWLEELQEIGKRLRADRGGRS